jgi:hypothetical protein
LDKHATAHSNLGTALYQQGRYADAARSFEGAVALRARRFSTGSTWATPAIGRPLRR